MIQIVWRYRVKEDSRGKFELVYGPGGAWSTLFARAQGYRGTALLRDTENPFEYLTIDAWDSVEAHTAFLEEHQTAYAAMDADFSHLLETEAKIGTYKMLAESTVRPTPRAKRGRRSPSRRSQ